MNMLRVVLVLWLLLMLSGCIFLDVSCQDTAIPLYPKKISGSIHLTNAVDINDTYYTDTEDNQDPGRVGGTIIYGVKANVGISPRADLAFTMARDKSNSSGSGLYTTSEDSSQSMHAKFGVKYLLSHHDKTYVSVLPSLYLAHGEESGSDYSSSSHSSDSYAYEYGAAGVEAQLLVTHQIAKWVSATFVARSQINRIRKNLDGREYGPYVTSNFGIRGNIRLSAGIFHITPEFGLELFPIVNGDPYIARIGSLGFGLQF